MTTTTTGTRPDTAPRTPLFAALGLVTALVLTAVAFFWDITGNDNDNDPHAVRGYLITAAILVVVTALVFGLVVRTAAGSRPGLRSAILGGLAVASIVVFWSGLPSVFAAAALAAAVIEKDDTGQFGNAGKTGLALAGLAAVAAVVFTIIG